jgi:hypothetical protein
LRSVSTSNRLELEQTERLVNALLGLLTPNDCWRSVNKKRQKKSEDRSIVGKRLNTGKDLNMHTSLPTWLALSAAILPTATAFYPYHYDSGSTPSSSTSSRSRRTPEHHSDANTRGTTLPLRRVPAPIRPRQNIYNIVNSNNPSQENSVAIDQDGSDLSYMVAVTFGDSKEEYHMLLDSAASNTWVMGQDCSSAACTTHATFGRGDSSTLKVCPTYTPSRKKLKDRKEADRYRRQTHKPLALPTALALLQARLQQTRCTSARSLPP